MRLRTFAFCGCGFGWLLLFLTTATAALPPGKGAGPRFDPIQSVEITVPHRAALEQVIHAGYDVDDTWDNTARLYVDSEELAALRSAGFELRILPKSRPAEDDPAVKQLGTYHAYTALTTLLNAYATNHPAICRRTSLGRSVQGRELWALKISDQVELDEDEPAVAYVSTLHGDEPVGTEMCLYLIDLLLNGYATNDARIVSLVNTLEIWVLPLANPDGRERSSRYNANAYDLNRSFPEGSSINLGNLLYGPAPNTNGLQPEVRHLMAWTAAQNFVLGANFHTGARVVNYPYDSDSQGSVFSPTPDQALYLGISQAYASNNPALWNNQSGPFVNGVVNGAEWYEVYGGLQDWVYRYQGGFHTTIELSDTKFPSASTLPTHWANNRAAMLAYLEWARRGVGGTIRDAQSGAPVAATVRVEGYHHLVFSESAVGDYHRLLLPGTYTVWFYAPGYMPQRVTNVTVNDGVATRLDVTLEPASSRFAAQINFQTAGAAVPRGFVADTGAVYASRGNGFSYGWSNSLNPSALFARNNGRSQDPRYDTGARLSTNETWQIEVPNGPYRLLLVAGDSAVAQGRYDIWVEGAPFLDGVASAAVPWVEALGEVVVTDERLMLQRGPGSGVVPLSFLELSAIDPTTYAHWCALYFGRGASALEGDPDQDGTVNLLEYALGRNPNLVELEPHLQPVVIGTNHNGRVGVSFTRNTQATDLDLRVLMTVTLPSNSWETLAAWTSSQGWVGPGLVTETPVADGVVQVRVLLPENIPGSTTHFIRLRVTPGG